MKRSGFLSESPSPTSQPHKQRRVMSNEVVHVIAARLRLLLNVKRLIEAATRDGQR